MAASTGADAIEAWTRGAYEVSTDPARLDAIAIHAYLARSYWAEEIPLALVRRSLAGSYCFGLYTAGAQVGLARVISDFATFAWLCDVYVLEAHRGAGLGKFLMACVMESNRLQGLRRWGLVTRDAHALYAGHGWSALSNPSAHMEIVRPGMYRQPGPA